MRDRFFDVERTIHRTSAGLVELPILYFDASNVVALFEADAGGAERLLEGTGLVPTIVRGGRALVGLSFYEYRRTTVGVYNEVGVAIFARPCGERALLPALADLLLPPARRRSGAWVVDLPVTTEAANAAGRELWGYPKFVTSIDFALTGRRFRSTVHDPSGDEAICEIAGEMDGGIRVPSLSLVTFSKLDDTLVRTHVDVRAPTRACRRGDVRLRIGRSSHRMARDLRDLDLDGAHPTMLLVTERFQSLLHAGRKAAPT
jgi:hypothetical protein